MTEYEVKCPQTWAWYTGFVHDYNESDKKLYIRYPNDWKKPEWMDISSVRYKYAPEWMATWQPAENEEVECKARAEEHEPYGWWPCKARRYVDARAKLHHRSHAQPADELYSVQFIGWGDQHNEILGRDFLRRKSRSACLSARNVTKKRYDVPPSLREWVSTRCQQRTILETLMPHKNIASQIIHISFAESTDKLVLIGMRRVLVTMQDIIYCFFEKQKSLLALERRTKEMERRRDERKQAELAAEKTTFNIHPLLSGYLRGRKNTNIERVQQMQGVIRVEPGHSTCYVAAKTKAALRDAVDLLHIVCRKVVIPNEEMGQIIGFKGAQIQDIKAKSKVIKVISWNKWKDEFATLKRIQISRSRDRGDRGYGAGRDGASNNYDEGDALTYDSNSPRGVGLGMTAESIQACDMDNIFGVDDVVDLTVGFSSEFAPFSDDEDQANQGLTPRQGKAVKTDALIIIGRKSRVELCIFMLEMTLNHFRTITRARNDERRLRREISRLKGTAFGDWGRGRGRGRRGGYRGGRGGRGGRDRDRDRRYRGDRDRGDRDRGDRRRDGDRARNDRDRAERERGDRGGRDRGDRVRGDRAERDRQPRNRDRDRDREQDDHKDGSQQSNERREQNRRRRGRDTRDGGAGSGRSPTRDKARYRKKEQQGQGQGQGQGQAPAQHDEKAQALGQPQRDVRKVEAQAQAQTQGGGDESGQAQDQGRGKRRNRARKKRGGGSGSGDQETRGAAQQQSSEQ